MEKNYILEILERSISENNFISAQEYYFTDKRVFIQRDPYLKEIDWGYTTKVGVAKSFSLEEIEKFKENYKNYKVKPFLRTITLTEE